MNQNIEWITDTDSLKQMISQWQSLAVLGFDTEFERIRTYYPKLALIQIAKPGLAASSASLVDPLLIADLKPLGDALLEPGRDVIIHSASEDLTALKPILSAPLLNLFDTQIACAFANYGQGLGYARLVQSLVGIELPKSETRSDWMHRPLSEAQLDYAVTDVEHLESMRAQMLDKMRTLGTESWFYQDCQSLARKSFDDRIPDNLHWDIRSAYKLSRQQQAQLNALMIWREQLARQIDRPKSWIFDNDIAIQLTSNPPSELTPLRELMRSAKAFPKSALDSLLVFLRQEVNIESHQDSPLPLDSEDKTMLDRVKAEVEKIAESTTVPTPILLPRRGMECLVREKKWPLEFCGWREELMKNTLMSLILD